MAKKFLCMMLLILTLVMVFVACDSADTPDTPDVPDAPAHTHAYGEWEITKAATCTAVGSKDRYCSCGEKQTATISATGHSFGSWITVKEASTSETGSKERVCSCGEKETQVIEKIAVLKTVNSGEWNTAFNTFGRGDFSTVIIDISDTTTEVANDAVYGFDMVVTADFQNGTINMNGVYFQNGAEDEIDEQERFESGGNSFGEFVCTDTMRVFWRGIRDLSDKGYSQFTYDTVSESYHRQTEIDSVLCDVNVYFEDGRIVKVSIVSTENGDVTLNSTYTYTYH